MFISFVLTFNGFWKGQAGLDEVNIWPAEKLEHLYNNVMTNSLSIDISASISNDEVVFILSMVHSTIVGFLSSEWMLKEGGHSTSCLTRLLFLHL